MQTSQNDFVGESMLGPFLNNFRKGKDPGEFGGQDIEAITGSPWLKGQYDGNPVDPSGWDALALASIIPPVKFLKNAKPKAVAKPAPMLDRLIDGVNSQRDKLGAKLLANMVKNTTGIAVRTKPETVFDMITRNGKYGNAFETGSGADFADLKVDTEGLRTRLQAEKLHFGLDFDADPTLRPIYAALVTDNKLARVANEYLGGDVGTRLNAVTAPNKANLNVYGNVALHLKNKLKKKSSLFVGDLWQDFYSRTQGRPITGNTVPISAKPKDIMDKSGIKALLKPFGENPVDNTYNAMPPYIEAHTPGGFGLSDVKKIVVGGRLGAEEGDKLADEIFKALRESGHKGIKVQGPSGRVRSELFKMLLGTGFANGGIVSKIKPSYFNTGGLAKGTDTIPAMLTPGEFVMTRSAVQNFGVDNLKAINSGNVSPVEQTSVGDSVYNSNSYSISVNVSSASDPDDIARTVMAQIQRIDAQTTRSNRY
jgi:hypothetical protein